jgi:Domain of unknown function (DUF4177)
MDVSAEALTEPALAHAIKRYEYKIIDTSERVEKELNDLGAEGWQVVGVTTKKQLFIAPPAAIILMRELQS